MGDEAGGAYGTVAETGSEQDVRVGEQAILERDWQD